MMHYMDSSALIKIYIDEVGSEWTRAVRERSESGDILICEISGAEVFAAFHRRFRAGDVPEGDLQGTRRLFQQDFESFFACVPITKRIVGSAMQLVQKYPLRGYDAIQLASVLSFFAELKPFNGGFAYFVCADKILNDAARNEGLSVIDPSEEQ